MVRRATPRVIYVRIVRRGRRPARQLGGRLQASSPTRCTPRRSERNSLRRLAGPVDARVPPAELRVVPAGAIRWCICFTASCNAWVDGAAQAGDGYASGAARDDRHAERQALDGSFYTNSATAGNWDDFISMSLLPSTRNTARSRGRRAEDWPTFDGWVRTFAADASR